MEQYDIALLGGDTRTAYMAPYFLEKGYRVICYGIENVVRDDEYPFIYAKTLKEAVEQSDYIVGGIPLFKEGKVFSKQNMPDRESDELCQCLRKKQIVFGGVIPQDFMEMCKEREIGCYDFMKDEALAVFNAIATAEGSILEALKYQKTNIHGSKSLVLGYGRCGRVLAEKLRGLGADLTVCSRCEVELAYADAFGLNTFSLKDLEGKVHKFEYIYNTVPAVLLGKNILERMRRDVLVIDIASGLGGVDYYSAEKMGIAALHCLGLPGKYAPKISAKRLVDFVIYKIER